MKTPEKVAVHIDGVEYQMEKGSNLLHAVLSHKLDLPYFCWHPSFGSVGACRQCAVIQYAGPEDERGRLQMACMTNVTDDMYVSIDAPFASDFRSSVIEWLMQNHPHDCPVCEEGGECHLQDMTVMTGHSVRRYRSQKRTWRNQNLGPFIGHEMNRCITCYRCVRYYDEYAGGKDLGALGSRGRMFFGRFEDGTLESEFAGNLVEVCPTGVFTDKPFASTYTRKWDLQTAPSICPGCAVGCNVFPAERYGELKRITNRYHGQINGYFLCDRGRFGSHFVNRDDRIKNVGIAADDGSFEYGTTASIIESVAEKLSSGAIGIGSPRASFEANFLLRELVGADRFCSGIADSESAVVQASIQLMRNGGFKVPTLEEVEHCDAVFILGEDICNTAPRLALSVRQASRIDTFELADGAGIPAWQDAGVRGHAQHRKNPLFVATPASTRLDEIAQATTSGSVSKLEQLAQQVASCVSRGELQASDSDFATNVATALVNAKNPLIIAGSSLESARLVEMAGRIARLLSQKGCSSNLCLIPREVNAYGVSMLEGDLSLSQALQHMADEGTAVILENDLYLRADSELVSDALINGYGVSLDCLETATVSRSDFVFPAATYAEQTGTYVNYELRAQRFFQVFEPRDEIRSSWNWLGSIAGAMGKDDLNFRTFDALSEACVQSTFPELARVAPSAEFRLKAGTKIPRQTHRYSGRTAMRAHKNIHEPKTSVDDESPFSFSMEGQNPGDQNGSTIPYSWSPGWNSNQSVFKFQQDVGGELAGGDPGVRLVAVPNSYEGLEEPVGAGSPTQLHEEKSSLFERVNVPQVFGSDELSNYSWPIRQRTSAPFVLVCNEDASRLGVEQGMGVKVEGVSDSLEVRIDTRIEEGVIGIPMGMVSNFHVLPTQVEIRHDPDFVRLSGSDPDVIARS